MGLGQVNVLTVKSYAQDELAQIFRDNLPLFFLNSKGNAPSLAPPTL